MTDDVIIIGGGAAGLCAAVRLKQNNPDFSVRILESQPRVGKKLALTGNGRCNITNRKASPQFYHGKNREFCSFALSKYDLSLTEAFFEKLGVVFCFEGNKGYPASFQAASVVDCLRFSADLSGVKTLTETKVTDIKTAGDKYKVIAGNLSFYCRNIIVASGLYSGGDRLGCDGSVLDILKRAGFKTVNCRPAIVQLKTVTDTVKQLKGIKLDGTVSLMIDGKTERSEKGEILFCDYGLSGPPVLQVSGKADAGKKCVISLDIMPDTDKKSLEEILEKRVQNLANRSLDEFFTGFLNKRVGQVILKSAGYKLSDKTSVIDDNGIKSVAGIIKDWRFTVTGNTGFINSQVSAGGLLTDGFNCETMESHECKGLYAVGEILDIDGDCGGFNLQWAWSSALCAADAITKGDLI